MTEEEMAEEYVKKEGFRSGMFGELDNITSSEANKEVKQAFLAGIKAGRPQWHDAKELPPKDENAPNTSIYVLDQYGQKVFYSFFYNVWKYESDFEVRVTHWCEIPTFDKE